MKTVTPIAGIGLIAVCAFCADPTPHDLVSQSITNYDKDWQAALDFTYTEREVTKDSARHPKTDELSQVNVFEGTPYSLLIAKNGHPLSAEQARKEDEKYRKMLAVRQKEGPGQHARRIRKYGEERQLLHEIPDAFDMSQLGHETIGGRPNYVITLTPKEGYVPKSQNARTFANIRGKLWIDRQDMRWTQAEASVIGIISIGWVLARIEPGAHITMKQVKVDGDHWMPKEIDVDGIARILLVKSRTLDQTVSFDNYKRLGPTPEPPPQRIGSTILSRDRELAVDGRTSFDPIWSELPSRSFVHRVDLQHCRDQCRFCTAQGSG